MEFEVRNDGNKADRFDVSLVVPEGMVAEVGWEVSPWIAPGASENVSVSFSFLPGTEGQLQLGVTATSQNDPSISATGNALYRVGSQNWLRIPSVIPLEIDTADADHMMELTVRNQYTTAQAVAMELDAGEAGSYMQVRINSQDRNFVLQVGEERKVTVELIISETTLDNLDEDTKGEWVSADIAQAQEPEQRAALSRVVVAEEDVVKAGRGASGFALREASGVLLESAAHKMSKSRGNVVNPVRAKPNRHLTTTASDPKPHPGDPYDAIGRPLSKVRLPSDLVSARRRTR